ncbi:hypothetical protein INT45_005468 [Circinella minor]|uniref:DDE Tnp4 domain-containing protein n=1 Tax=Circinella minor TaxID=1195481 RepID=A0A8H7VG86_9FUNG|nr:hypothetical protein INT45_005468 [Circinella minor]
MSEYMHALAEFGIQQEILERRHMNRREHRPFNLDDYTNEKCESNFRFNKTQLRTIIYAMELPSHFVFCADDTKHHFQVSTEEAMAICLRRLAYPAHFEDLGHIFCQTTTTLSIIFNTMIEYLFAKYKSTLNFAESQFTRDHLQLFANAIAQKGAPISNVAGFIDGTVRGICRPYKHALKYQAMTTLDGITAHLFSPICGTHHDGFILTEAKLLETLEDKLNFDDGCHFVLYGDPAYRHHQNLVAPFVVLENDRTSRESLYNQKMSKVRVAVEWEFGRTVNLFAFLDYHKDQKVWLSPVGAYYFVTVLFKNIKICLRGGQACKYFGIDPPTIHEYLEHGNHVFREQQ